MKKVPVCEGEMTDLTIELTFLGLTRLDAMRGGKERNPEAYDAGTTRG